MMVSPVKEILDWVGYKRFKKGSRDRHRLVSNIRFSSVFSAENKNALDRKDASVKDEPILCPRCHLASPIGSALFSGC
jgi:hypothetical protein